MSTNVVEADSTNKDAFGAYRVSEKTTVVDFQNTVEFDTRYFFNAVIYDSASPVILAESPNASGSGVNGSFIGPLDASSRMVPLELDSTYSAGQVVLQLKEYASYTPAKSQLFYRTGIFSPNTNKPNEQISVVIRTSCSGTIENNIVSRDSWNKDTLSGLGGRANPSGIKILTENIQLFWIDAQMLYAGRVRFGFSFNGKDVVVHEFNFANFQNLPTMQNFNLPPRQEIINVSGRASSRIGIFDKYNGLYLDVEDDFNAGKAKTFMQCGSILSEGGKDLGGIATSEFNTSPVTIGTSLTPIVSIRPTPFFNNLPSNSLIIPMSFSAINSGNSDCVLVLVHSATITGGSWGPAGDGGLFHTYEVNSTATGMSDGHVLVSEVVQKSSGSKTESVNKSNLRTRVPVLYSRVDDLEINAETLTLAAITNTSTTISMSSLDIEETRQ